MTLQAHDVCRIDEIHYDVCAWSGPGRVRPSDFGITPTPHSTYWHRGWAVKYAVRSGSRRLDEMRVNCGLTPDDALRIAGGAPVAEDGVLCYRELDAPVPLTGGLLLDSELARRIRF